MLALGCPGSVGLERSALDFTLRANVAACTVGPAFLHLLSLGPAVSRPYPLQRESPPRSLAGRPCQQHPRVEAGSSSYPTAAVPAASSVDLGPPRGPGGREAYRTQPAIPTGLCLLGSVYVQVGRAGKAGSVCSGRPWGQVLWAAMESPAPGAGTGDVLITQLWLEQRAVFPSRGCL